MFRCGICGENQPANQAPSELVVAIRRKTYRNIPQQRGRNRRRPAEPVNERITEGFERVKVVNACSGCYAERAEAAPEVVD